jgi:hypothetical protein
MMWTRGVWVVALLVGCGAPSDPGDAGHDASRADAPGIDAPGTDAPSSMADAARGDAAVLEGTLSAEHPGDIGLGSDPDVIWFEDFEEGSLDAIAARYDQVQGRSRWSLVTDTPSGTGSAIALRAGQGEDAVDFYKELPPSDEWWVRWYARYEAGVHWHHSGVWFGGYEPAMRYPSPMAGLRPNGDDRFSIAIEPVWDVGGASPRFDTYDYWSTMHSWMASPIADDGTAYYGNPVVHRSDFSLHEDAWTCLEVHARVNTDGSSGAGAILEVFQDDALMRGYDDAGPMGWWVRDKFCPEGTDATECTDYPAPATERLDLTFRTTTALQLNAFWPQNYITDDEQGTLSFDQMVVARRRVGCMR